MQTVRSDGAHFFTLATPATGIQSSLFEKLTATGTTPPPRGGRVSAVMFSEHLHVSRVAAELPTLWLNSWAHNPIRGRLPFQTHTAHNTGEVFLAMEATTAPETLFNLPPNWPGF
jgi:hypothetical protein